jgi:hypothetical protein
MKIRQVLDLHGKYDVLLLDVSDDNVLNSALYLSARVVAKNA